MMKIFMRYLAFCMVFKSLPAMSMCNGSRVITPCPESYVASADMHYGRALMLADACRMQEGTLWERDLKGFLENSVQSAVGGYLCALNGGAQEAQYKLLDRIWCAQRCEWLREIRPSLFACLHNTTSLGESGVRVCQALFQAAQHHSANDERFLPLNVRNDQAVDEHYGQGVFYKCLESADIYKLHALLEYNTQLEAQWISAAQRRICAGEPEDKDLVCASYLAPKLLEHNEQLVSIYLKRLKEGGSCFDNTLKLLKFLAHSQGYGVPCEIFLSALGSDEGIAQAIVPLLCNRYLDTHKLLYFKADNRYKRLLRAACNGSSAARSLLAVVCTQASALILPDMAWLAPLVNNCCMQQDSMLKSKAEILSLIGGTGENRKQAFEKIIALLNRTSLFKKNVNVASLMSSWSSELIQCLEQCACGGDLYAQLIVALRALILRENRYNPSDLHRIYTMVQAITAIKGPWVDYIKLALADLVACGRMTTEERIFAYFNLTYSEQPYIVAQSASRLALFSLPDRHDLAYRLLAIHENSDSPDIVAFTNAIQPCLHVKGIRTFFEKYLNICMCRGQAQSPTSWLWYNCEMALAATEAARDAGLYDNDDAIIKLCKKCADLNMRNGRVKHALTFWVRAAMLQDKESEQRIASMCIADPIQIRPCMRWIKPYVEQALKDKMLHANIVHFYAQLIDGTDDFKQAFVVLLSLLQKKEAYVRCAAHNMSQAFKEKLLAAEKTDKYATLINAIFDAVLHVDSHYNYQIFDTIDERDNPWILYVQCLLLEQHDRQNQTSNELIGLWGKLLGVHEDCLAGIARTKLGLCTEEGNEMAHTLLLCDALKREDACTALRLFNSHTNKSLLYAYCQEHCFELLERQVGHSAPAAYILGSIYSSMAEKMDSRDSAYCKKVESALNAFMYAHKNGLRCESDIAQVGKLLLIYYQMNGNKKCLQSISQIIGSICSQDSILELLERLLMTKNWGARELAKIISYLDNRLQHDGDLAYKLALLYRNGKELALGCTWPCDIRMALTYATRAACNNCAQADVLCEQLKQDQLKALCDVPLTLCTKVQESKKQPRKLKNNAPKEPLVAVPDEQTVQLTFEQNAKILNNLSSYRAQVIPAVKSMMSYAHEGHGPSMRFMGLYLQEDHCYKKDHVHKADEQKAYELLYTYFRNNPQDTAIGKALLVLIAKGTHLKHCMDTQESLDILKELSSKQDFCIQEPEAELLGMMCFRLGDYTRAHTFFDLIKSPAPHVAWCAAVAMLHEEGTTLEHGLRLKNYFLTALTLVNDAFAIRADQLVECQFVIKVLLQWPCCEARSFIFRIATIIGFYNSILSSLLDGWKDIFGSLVADPSQAGILLYVARHNIHEIQLDQFDLKKSAAIYGQWALDHVDVAIDRRLLEEIIDQLQRAIIPFMSNLGGEIDEMELEAVYFLALMLLQSSDQSSRNVGLKFFVAAEKALFNAHVTIKGTCDKATWQSRRTLAYCGTLLENAKDPSNWQSFFAFMTYMIHRFRDYESYKDLASYINKFEKEFVDTRPGALGEVASEFAFICKMIGATILGTWKFLGTKFVKYFKAAYEFDPDDIPNVKNMCIVLLQYEQSEENAKKGLSLLKHVIDTTTMGDPCNYVSLFYFGVLHNRWIKPNRLLAQHYLRMAVERHDDEAMGLWDSMGN